MQVANENTFRDRMLEMRTRIATLRERAKSSKKDASRATDQQLRAFEDQYRLLKAEFEKKQLSAQQAYAELTESTRKAWDELWTGVDRAYRNLH